MLLEQFFMFENFENTKWFSKIGSKKPSNSSPNDLIFIDCYNYRFKVSFVEEYT